MEDLDEACPVIEHTPIEGAQTQGLDVELTAVVTDVESGILIVAVFYKEETSATWSGGLPMVLQDDVGTYLGTIPGRDVTGGGMDYFIAAVDISDNACTFPDDGGSDALHFRVSA